MSNYLNARVCIYSRVSTSHQAQNDLSIPDQIQQAKAWCEQNGAQLVDTMIEAGASATDDNRPIFQEMVTVATASERPYDIILVHSLSRLFRNAMNFLQYRAMLKRHNIRIVSITQDFGDDAPGHLSLGMLALFDEYHSMETAKHTQRAMLENARLGFWNGQTPPLGYETYEAERRGSKSKKRLEIKDDEAFTVRKIFDLYLRGPAGQPPMGITRLSSWLNKNGYKYRGRKLHVSNVQQVLRNTAYIGVAFYNKRDSKTRKARPEEEWIPIPVPQIIDTELFETVQARLVDRRVTNRPARVTTTNNLLIGIARCGCSGDGCGGGMTASTGKSGQYKYYACSNRARAGTSICKGRRIPMAKLDGIVMQSLEKRLLTEERLHELLSGWLDHSANVVEARREKLRQLKTRKSNLEAGSARLIDLVADGHLTASDPQFSKKYAELREQTAQVTTDIIMIERQLANSERRITPELIERFAGIMRDRLNQTDPALRQFYVRSIVGRVDVGKDQIRISGSTKSLERAVGRVDSKPSQLVPSIEREWCALQDSNLRPQD